MKFPFKISKSFSLNLSVLFVLVSIFISCSEEKRSETPEPSSEVTSGSAALTPMIQLDLYKDPSMANSFEIEKLREFLDKLPDLKKEDDFTYKGADGFPKMNMSLLFIKQKGDFSITDRNVSKTNYICVTCVRTTKEDLNKQIKLLTQVASFMNWKLLNNFDDEGRSDVLIWEPS